MMLAGVTDNLPGVFLKVVNNIVLRLLAVLAVAEVCGPAVAGEVRIFPLLDHGGQPSPHVEPVCQLIEEQGGRFVVESVDYRFQRGGNQMLRFSC